MADADRAHKLQKLPGFRFPYRVDYERDPRSIFGESCTKEMTEQKKKEKDLQKQKRKKQKRNALIMCHDGKEYWTTQAQFWQWVRESVVVKLSDGPLRGRFIRQNEEYSVVISNTVLNLKCPNHLREALLARRRALQ